MSAIADLELEELAKRAEKARKGCDEMEYRYRVLLVTLTKRALAAGKGYGWVAKRLGVTDTAVRRFYRRNNLSIGPTELRDVAQKIGWPALGEGEG